MTAYSVITRTDREFEIGISTRYCRIYANCANNETQLLEISVFQLSSGVFPCIIIKLNVFLLPVSGE